MRHISTLLLTLLTALCAAVEVGPYKVTKVVDGDTIKIQTDLGEQTVRILYIDTPESADNSHGKKMPEGLKAKAFLSELLKDSEVKLWGPDKELEQDRYGRILAVPKTDLTEVVETADGSTERHVIKWEYVSIIIVAAGHSPYWRKYGDAPDKELHVNLKLNHEAAKKHKRGAWATAPKYMTDKTNERTAPKDETKEALKQLDDAVIHAKYKAELEKNPEHTHWLNEKGDVRHNKDCRWFGKTKKGKFCTKDAGKACGQCGG